MSNVIVLEPIRWIPCAMCGHARAWHATDDKRCTYEVDDAQGWITCGCERWRP